VRVLGARVLDETGVPVEVMRRDAPFTIEVRFTLSEAVPGLDIALVVANRRGVRVLDELWSDSMPEGRGAAGEHVARVTVPPVLNGGEYDIGIWFGTAYEQFVNELELLTLRLEGGAADRAERAVCLDLPWDVRRI
jgi:ABC-2 type transport system ATP-binding protein/lipopolysaccharide transport system ATP-binding protein